MILGIDLGTTFSSAACVNCEGIPRIIVNSEGENATPSVVLFEGNNEVVVGSSAKATSIIRSRDIVMDVKNMMGKKTVIKEVNEKKYSPEMISSFILRKVIQDAENYTGEKVDGVVVSVPAYFNDSRRKATADAVQIAGASLMGMINEPTAAALFYAYNSDIKNQNVLVYDLGGGTFDVTIVHIEDMNRINVLCTDGLSATGGRFFDQCIIDYVVESLEQKYGIDLEDEEYLDDLQELAIEAEKIKKQLSSCTRANVVIKIGKQVELVIVSWADRKETGISRDTDTVQIIGNQNSSRDDELKTQGTVSVTDERLVTANRLNFEEANYKEAYAIYEQLANEGVAEAQKNLGFMYILGKGIMADAERGYKWMEKAAQNGDPVAMGIWADYLISNKNENTDFGEILSLYEKASMMGNTKTNYGAMYLDGLGVEKDIDKAKEILTKSADEGNTASMILLGKLADDNTQEGVDAAIDWYTKAANMGDSDAAYLMSKYVNRKLFTGKDPNTGEDAQFFTMPSEEERLPWLQRAVDNEYPCPDALAEIGNFYEYGKATAKNVQKAREYYARGAECGNRYAMYRLGVINYDEKNYDDAIFYLKKAYDTPGSLSENNEAILYCYIIWYYCCIIEDFSEARQFLEYAIENGLNYVLTDPTYEMNRWIYWDIMGGTLNPQILLRSYPSIFATTHNDEQMSIIKEEAQKGNIFAKKIVYDTERHIYAARDRSIDGWSYGVGMDYAIDLIKAGDLETLYNEGERLSILFGEAKGQTLMSEAVNLGYTPPAESIIKPKKSNTSANTGSSYQNTGYNGGGGNARDYDIASDHDNNGGYNNYSSGNSNTNYDTDADYAARSFGYQDAQDFQNQTGEYGTEDNIYGWYS